MVMYFKNHRIAYMVILAIALVIASNVTGIQALALLSFALFMLLLVDYATTYRLWPWSSAAERKK